MRTGQKSVLAVLLGSFASVTTAWAQGNLGGLTGHVSDATGGVVTDAIVRATNLDTGANPSATSGSEGFYRVPGLVPGRYRVSVTKPGFKTYEKEPVTISTETTSTLDISLEVGDVQQAVTVSGDTIEMQTTSAEIGTVMPRQNLLDLPISLGGSLTTGASGRRQIESFTFLTPGVTGTQWSKSINGAPGFSQDVLYDGLDAQNIGAPGFIAESSPPYEAVQEFKVQNTLYPAEYGLGFGVLNFTLKSGTNKFHGDLFEFVRNNHFDARGFFSTYKRQLQQNEYGGTVGGPLVLPRIYDGKNKTFFFFAYSGFQLRGGLPARGLVSLPSAQERQGDFSDYPFPIFDPATTRSDGKGGFVRDPFGSSIIPATRFSGVAQRAIPLLPQTTLPGYFNNYVDHSYQPTSENDWSIKIDHTFSEKQRLSGSFWRSSADTTIYGAVAGAWDPDLRHTPTYGGGLRVNHYYTFRSNLLNHIGFGYTPVTPTWSYWLSDPRLGNQTLKIPGIPDTAHGFPRFDFSSIYNSLGNAPNQAYDPQDYKNWAVSEDLSWTRGRHQLKFGGQYRYRTIVAGDFSNEAGTFSFDALSTSQPNDANFNNWGNAFASFLLGQVMSAQRQVPEPVNHFRDIFWGFHAEDSVRVTSKTTLTLGLRYEVPIQVRERDGIMSLLDLKLPNPGAGGRPGAMVFLGAGPGRTGTYDFAGDTYRRAFSPRLGLAHALTGKTVVRLGYGIFYMYANYGRVGAGGCFLGWCQGFGALPAFSSNDSGITPAMLLDTGFPTAGVKVPNFDPAIANDGIAPYINSSANKPALDQSWTVDIERQLPGNILLDAAYVGSHTSRLWTGFENINQVNPKYLSLGSTLYAGIDSPAAVAAGIARPYPGFSGSVAQALRPYPQYATIYDMFQPTGYTTYQSLQVRLQKRYSYGLSFLGSYTLAKNIGIARGDTFGDIAGGGGATPLDTFNRNLEKSILPNDQTHTFIISWTYELPVGRGKPLLPNLHGAGNQILGGWQINSIETYHSGVPVGVGGGPNMPLFGGGNRPNWVSPNVRTAVSMGSFDPAKDRYLDIAAFSQPAPFTFGNAPYRLPNVRTPAFYSEDFSTFKRFTLPGETRSVEFRAEFFNLLNRVVFGGIASSVNNSSTFGRIRSQSNTPRVIQFGLKLLF